VCRGLQAAVSEGDTKNEDRSRKEKGKKTRNSDRKVWGKKTEIEGGKEIMDNRIIKGECHYFCGG
jgi:hypothetical protein